MNKKIAIVTGASRGIGKEVAEHLSDLGYLVVLIARNAEILQQVCNSIINKGGESIFFAIDISDANQVQTCIQNVISKYARIDLLFNNAAILKQGTSSVPAAEIDQLLKINLNGAIYIASCVSAQMKQQKSGYIINVASIGGKIAQSFSGIYAASKFGMVGFSEALAKEMAEFDVKVTCLCPSLVATEMTSGRKFSANDMIQTEDINKTVSYLLSLSKNAVPFEIMINCLPFAKKLTKVMHEVYGFGKTG